MLLRSRAGWIAVSAAVTVMLGCTADAPQHARELRLTQIAQHDLPTQFYPTRAVISDHGVILAWEQHASSVRLIEPNGTQRVLEHRLLRDVAGAALASVDEIHIVDGSGRVVSLDRNGRELRIASFTLDTVVDAAIPIQQGWLLGWRTADSAYTIAQLTHAAELRSQVRVPLDAEVGDEAVPIHLADLGGQGVYTRRDFPYETKAVTPTVRLLVDTSAAIRRGASPELRQR